MLGRTNLLFVAGDNTSELAFTPDYILTSASGNILKIEYINDLFFVFTEDEKVLYGSDMNNLQTLKNGNEAFAAKHIIYADGVYYLTKIERTTSKAIIYKSSDLISYEVITLKTGTSSYSYPVHGLFLDSKGEIVVLIEEYKDTYSSHNRYLLIVDTLEGFQEESASFIEVTPTPYNKNTTAIGTRLKKDRIFTYINASSSYDDGGRMISLDGTMSSVDMYSFFALDYFFKLQSHSPSRLYYSLNGTDYISLEFSNDVTDFNAINVFEYGGTIALIYRCTENEETVTKMTTAATPKELIKATASAIPVTIDYGMIANSNVYVDEYAYLGSTGGIVIKGKIDNAETERPDVVVVKGMAAKEALKQANDYTDEKYKTITKEVELHEETTKQYMENAFHATPEGYAALVDTVSENKVKIDTIIEKADLRIKADASGEEIHLIDSAEGKAVEFALYGKAKQNTTSGKNLFDFENVSFRNNGDSTFVKENNMLIVTASNSLNSGVYSNPLTEDLIGKTLTFSADVTISDGTKVKIGIEEGHLTLSLTPNTKTKITHTITTTKNPKIIVYSSEEVAKNITVENIQIEYGEVATPFEEFTGGQPSPNPQYPQPIEVSGASGSVEARSCGENKIVYPYLNTTKTQAGITYTDNNGIVVVNGKAIGYSEFEFRNRKETTSPLILQAGTYKLIGCPKGGTENGYRLVVCRTSSSNAYEAIGFDYGYGLEFTLNAETQVGVLIQVQSGELKNLAFKPMLYNANEETLATIPTENGLASVNDAHDVIVKYADGSGEHIQRVKKKLLSESTEIVRETINDKPRFRLSNICNGMVSTGTALVSNIFVADMSPVTMSDNVKDNTICGYNGGHIAYVLCSSYTDVETFRQMLIDTNAYVLYALAEPIETPLTAEEIAEIEKLSTFYPVTNISNDGICDMKVTYVADSKNYIDRMVAEQVASIVANMNK